MASSHRDSGLKKFHSFPTIVPWLAVYSRIAMSTTAVTAVLSFLPQKLCASWVESLSLSE